MYPLKLMNDAAAQVALVVTSYFFTEGVGKNTESVWLLLPQNSMISKHAMRHHCKTA
jgi:hypothetical protein